MSVLFDELHGFLHVVGSVFLNVLLLVAERRGQLERRDAVLALESVSDNAVAHERAVACRVDLYGATAEYSEIVIDRDAGLSLRHRADITRKPKFLSNVEVVCSRILCEEVRNEHGRDLSEDSCCFLESHHECCHGVLVCQHAVLREFFVVARAAVALEDVVHRLGYVVDDEVHCLMRDAQRLVPESQREFIHHVRNSQIVGHPPVAEHRLDVARLRDEPCENGHDVEPSRVIVKSILYTSPLTADEDLGLAVGRIQLAQRLIAFFLLRVSDLPDRFECHYFSPPWSFFISMLSMKACTRVRIWPAPALIL